MIRLPAQPASVSVARRHVRTLLEDLGGEGSLVDDVALVVTELVANAVLHAGAPISLTVRRLDDRPDAVRVEVADGSPAPPVARSYGSQASTGRGLALVARVATRWGVDQADGGKSVWAEVDSTTASSAAASSPLSTLASPDDANRSPADSVPICFVGVPVAAYLRLQEQNDALLRELELLAFTDDPDRDARRHSPELTEVIERSRRFFGATQEGLRGAVLEAAAAGRTVVDLDSRAVASRLGAAHELIELYERAEELAERGELLVAPADPEVVRLRRWFVDEMGAQLAGRAPTAFPT
jgi:anti-sigma regulatory factor (Ser/Thr protein kinase)